MVLQLVILVIVVIGMESSTIYVLPKVYNVPYYWLHLYLELNTIYTHFVVVVNEIFLPEIQYLTWKL